MTEARLPAKKAVEIADYLEGLGATDLVDFAGLEGEHLGNLLKLVPPLKLDKFKERLACHCPVLLCSPYFVFCIFFLRSANRTALILIRIDEKGISSPPSFLSHQLVATEFKSSLTAEAREAVSQQKK